MSTVDLKHCDKISEVIEELNISVTEGIIDSRHLSKSLEGMKSRLHGLGREVRMHLLTVGCDTFSNEKNCSNCPSNKC